MSAKTIKELVDNGPYVLKNNNKLSTDIENEAIEKDIAVENVIRRLRQKKNIEVKKVNDMDSKLNQISSSLGKKSKPEVEESDQPKSSIINLNPVVDEQKIYSGHKATSAKTTNFLEIEDDEIEDYLEIDQNVVKDLEALIPEEEIVSISNSLIQPKERLSTESLQNETLLETKPENSEVSEPIIICDSIRSEDPKHEIISQDFEVTIKRDEEIEDKVDGNDKDLIDSCSKGEISSNKKNCNVKINNNECDSGKNNETLPLSTFNEKTSVTTLEEDLPNPEMETYEINRVQPKKQEPLINKKLKLKPNVQGNFKKITDFLIPNSMKNRLLREQKLMVEEILPIKHFQNVTDAANLSCEIIDVDREEPIRTRSLRSRSNVNESKTRESQSVNETITRSCKEQIPKLETISVQMKIDKTNDSTAGLMDTAIDLNATELKNESSVLQETRSSQNACDIQLKNERTNEESSNSELERSMQLKSEPSKSVPITESSTCEFQSRGSEGSNTNILQFIVQPEVTNDIQNDEEQQVIEKGILPNLQETFTVTTENNPKEEIITAETSIDLKIKNETKDSNENHVFTGSSVEEKQINSIKGQHINKTQSKRRNTNRKKTLVASNMQDQKIACPMNGQKRTRNEESPIPKNSASDEIEGIKNKKRKKRQTPNKNQNSVPKGNTIFDSLDPAETVPKNTISKLEIYDFDDKSNEEIELLKKTAKKKKNHVPEVNQNESISSEEIPTENKRNGRNSLPKASVNISKNQVQPENINNNRLNTLPDDIESSFESENKYSTDFELGDDQPKDDKMNVDFNSSTSSNATTKAVLETVKEVQEYGPNWKPVYGPYKRIDRCNVCLMAFKSYKKLRAHKRVHEVENPYKCSKCAESFEDVEKLAAHLRIHKGYEVEMNLNELEPEMDGKDVKPKNVSLVNTRSYSDSKSKKVSDPNEASCESNEVSSTTSKKMCGKSKIERKSLRKLNKNKIIQTKIAEVKRKLTKAIKIEENNEEIQVPKKNTRSRLKVDLKKEQLEESEDSFLECYSVPVEDQDEYSEIANEPFELSSLIECDKTGEVEDQDQYSQVDNESFELSSQIECEEEEFEVEDQDEYSQLSHDDSEIFSLIESEKGEKEFKNNQEPIELENIVSIGMMNEMAEAEYLLESSPNSPLQPKKKKMPGRKNKKTPKKLETNEPKIIKVKRDNLPPLILKSIKNKKYLLGKMPFACKKCDATFWTSFQLDKHQLVHVLKKGPSPVKPPSKVFKCEECGKEFKKICDLERHTRVHTGEKPSVCNICNKRFQQAYNLNKHLYTHTQEKNYECVICQKKFGRNDVLNRHVLTHSIVKPFRCSICSRTFIRNSQLKLHLQKHHDLDEDPGNGSSVVDDPVASTSATES